MASKNIKFEAGDAVVFLKTSGAGRAGDFGTVESLRSDYTSGRPFVRVVLTSGANEGAVVSAYAEFLAYASPYATNEFTFTRERLNLWRKVLRGEQQLDEPDGEEIAAELDELLDPPITREYTITATGKADDINEAILGLTASEPILRDDITLSIEMKSERSAS